MKFYKVVRKRTKECKDLSSAIIGHDYVLKYKTQRWRRPILKGSKIFVFDSIENAQKFINKEYAQTIYSIYECEVKNPQKTTGLAFVPNTYSIERFWEGNFNSFRFPYGSYCVDAVKLIKKIK